MSTIAAFTSPINAIACLASLEENTKVDAILYNFGQPYLAGSIDVLRYVFGVFSLRLEPVPSRGEAEALPPHMLPFLALGKAQVTAEEIGADQIVMDLSAIDELRPQVVALSNAQVQLCEQARAALSLPSVPVVTPCLELAEQQIQAIALPFLSQRLGEFFTAVHDDALEEFYGFPIELPIFDGAKGWRALEFEAERLGVTKVETWRDTIPVLVEARVLEITSALEA